MADVAVVRSPDIKKQSGFAFIAGSCIAVLYLPMLVIIAYSFNSANNLAAKWHGFTTGWYNVVLANGEFYDSAILSVIVAVAATLISTVLATAAALGTTRGRPWRGQGSAYLAITTPLVVPEIVTGISLLSFFAFLSTVTGVDLGIWKLILAHSAFCIPFAYLPIRARLEGMDTTLDNAAADLYATPWKTFRYVTLPLLVPGISSGAALAFIVSFDDFTITQLIAGPGETTLPLYIWGRIRRTLTPELNAMCTLLLLISLAFIVLSFVLSHRRRA
ncbi:ABC transporter permease [Ensifer sesbaniae]|uniref:ABC transporter permease n=1 Tax=Ensifer sesbaniae TaxID=1214071 RepID=UPI00200070CE|nr:ABC transporter permease [Ensifer sesbaniae]